MRTKSSILINQTALPALVLALLWLAAPARADIILSVESVTGAPGSSGDFDVLLTNTGTSAQNIAAFNFELTTTDTNVTFTNVTTDTTTATYIFPTSGFGGDILTTASGQVAEAADFDGTFAGTVVGPGQTYGLGNVDYSIAGGAVSGEIATIDIEGYPDTSLSDENFNNVDFDVASGTITVQTTSTVPEPSTALPLAAAMLVGAWFIRQRRVA